MMAGAIAQEKERDTLGLLFLTDLTPWELVLQKYVGRLIPMLTLLFLSLPLLAVAYSLGGVSSMMLGSSAMTLFLTCLVVGALALECSAHEATTFQAVVRCWGLCFLFATCCSLGLPGMFLRSSRAGFGPGPSLFFLFPLMFSGTVYSVATAVFLIRAKQNLEPRAFIHRRNPFGHQFKQLDQYWKDIRKLTRALLRKRDKEASALAAEVLRKQLGQMGDSREWSLGGFLLARMQVPTLLAFAIILGFIVLIFVFITVLMDPKSAPFFVIVGGFWLLALLTVPILSANAIASERMNERLGAILTTPLTISEILAEWLAPVQRWIGFIVKPLVVIICGGSAGEIQNADLRPSPLLERDHLPRHFRAERLDLSTCCSMVLPAHRPAHPESNPSDDDRLFRRRCVVFRSHATVRFPVRQRNSPARMVRNSEVHQPDYHRSNRRNVRHGEN